MIETKIFDTFKIKNLIPYLESIEYPYCSAHLELKDKNFISKGLIVFYDEDKKAVMFMEFEEDDVALLYMALHSLGMV